MRNGWSLKSIVLFILALFIPAVTGYIDFINFPGEFDNSLPFGGFLIFATLFIASIEELYGFKFINQNLKANTRKIVFALLPFFLSVIVFGYFYNALELSRAGLDFHFSEATKETLETKLSQFDFFYFSFVVTATIGFGDIYPLTSWAKGAVMFHGFFNLVLVILFLNKVTNLFDQEDGDS